jgi:hypothetical protein
MSQSDFENDFKRMMDARIEEYKRRAEAGSRNIFEERLPSECYMSGRFLGHVGDSEEIEE